MKTHLSTASIAIRNLLSLLLLICLHTSCLEKDAPEPDNAVNTAPYTVSGIVLDTQGNPMAGVRVRADNDVLYGSAEVITDAQGRYKLPKLEMGGWKIYAWKEINYKGKTYHLRLGMPTDADYNAFSPGEKGMVKNFVWRLSGPIPDRTRDARSGAGYFGGTLLFRNLGPDAGSIPAGTVVTITLSPLAGASHFDGSAPQTVKKSFTIEAGEYNYWIQDIAQAEYRITAEAKLNGVVKQLLLSNTVYNGHAPAIESFYFKPHAASSGNYENGLLSSNDHPIFLSLQ